MRSTDSGSGRSRRWKTGAGVLWMLAMLLAGAAAAEPLSLDDCIELAIQNNPGLAASKQDLKSAEGSHLSSYSAFLPTVSAGGSLRQTKAGEVVDPFTGQAYQPFSEFYSFQTTLSQNLINLPSWFQYKAAGSDVVSAHQQHRINEIDLISGVRQQYFTLLKAILLKDVAVEALAVSEEQLRKSEALYELGSVARTDVLQARVNRAAAVQEEISARNAVDQERARLAVLLGLEVDNPLDIQLDVGISADYDISEPRLIQEALDTRPEVRRASAQVGSSLQRKRTAFWNQYPNLTGSLFWNRQANALHRRGEGLREIFDITDLESGASWGFNVGLNWRIFDGLTTIGSLQSAKASLMAAKEQQRQQELQAALAVREATVAIRNAQEGIRAAEESVALAAENLKLQQALYENGGGTILELNNALVENTRARTSLIEARIGLHLAYAQLDRAIGR